ncbi:hypothetical protein [Dyella lutea]|uniref:Porin n=1 Tax=Dyella lutea TaxID=2950441 RepID=A0ABT1F603_9GAMM|nr:hypothetical protein [Dyella lutea]MCP1372814.1 hypothetical protein [Dyella lutea]
MKRNPMFFAVAVALGLAVAGPSFAATKQKTDVKALQALIEKQQAQLDEQQKELAQMREALQQIQGNQQAQQQQIEKVASTPPPPPPAPSAFSSAPGVSVALHGFVSATAFSQDKSFTFGNGQNAEFPVTGSHGNTSGFDVRNTRFWLDFKGAKFNENWSGGGRIEMDFFGGFNGTGAYSLSQPTPRLRQAYMDLANASSGTTIRVGQQWDLLFPLDNVPASITHIAFPLGYGTGMIGWRFPGVVMMQDLNHGSDGPKWRLDLGAFEGSWDGPGNNVNYLTGGNAGFRPQLQARLHVQDKDWLAYFVAHYSQIDLRGVDGTAATPVATKIDSQGFEVGGNWHPGNWMFKGNLYTGKGLGQVFGGLIQFGDIKETGGFLQAGYKFTPNWSANAFYGYSKPKRSDVVAWLGQGSAGRLENRQSALNLIYTSGAYELGLEYMYSELDSTSAANPTATTTTKGNQVSLSAKYNF